jgi:hypothetical protein
MEDFTYEVKPKNMDQFRISKSDLKKKEDDIDKLYLKEHIRINGKNIETYGEIKKYLKKIKHIEKLEDYLEENDYVYLYNWLQFKLMGKIY